MQFLCFSTNTTLTNEYACTLTSTLSQGVGVFCTVPGYLAKNCTAVPFWSSSNSCFLTLSLLVFFSQLKSLLILLEIYCLGSFLFLCVCWFLVSLNLGAQESQFLCWKAPISIFRYTVYEDCKCYLNSLVKEILLGCGRKNQNRLVQQEFTTVEILSEQNYNSTGST